LYRAHAAHNCARRHSLFSHLRLIGSLEGAQLRAIVERARSNGHELELTPSQT